MINTSRAVRGIAVAPHSLAAQSALAVLREGGNAIEAMVAAAATIAVVYPHMTGIGGDGFWLIAEPGAAPRAIDACGATPAALNADFYRARGLDSIPVRGPLAANTVAGTIGGWDLALTLSREAWGGRLPLTRLLADAVWYAEEGIPVTASQEASTAGKLAELKDQPGFAGRFLVEGQAPRTGSLFVQTRAGALLEELAREGLDSFYRGGIAHDIASDLEAVGSPVTLEDLRAYRAQWRTPLRLIHSRGEVFNMTPPTQGLVSLIILGVLDRLGIERMAADSADYVHAAVEATKQAFLVRNRHITDPKWMTVEPQSLLDEGKLADMARAVDMDHALAWGGATLPGDTVWMGVIDGEGRAVSFIQSIYHEFGSGVVLPHTGINWQNRGCSFSLDPQALNSLAPSRKPFHTLNPALARLSDGRLMVYGTMGGDGQPQTQSAVFTRYAVLGQPLQRAVSAPRWLLGRTWGSMSESLKIEGRFGTEVAQALSRRGHVVEVLPDYDETMGHAGALVRRPDGVLEGASDPRGDGCVAGF